MYKQKSPKTHETISDRTEERNRPFYNNSYNFNTLLYIMGKVSRQKSNRKQDFKPQYKPNTAKRYTEHSTHQQQIRILLKCTWNIIQGRAYVRLQNKSQ